MLDCSFANSKDAPTSGLLAEKFLPLSDFCFIPVGLQVPTDGPLSCSPSYYRKGPRIGPNRRISSGLLALSVANRHSRHYREARQSGSSASHSSAAHHAGFLQSTRYPFQVCIQSSPDALHQPQNIKSSKTSNAVILQTLTLQSHSPQRNGLSFSWS